MIMIAEKMKPFVQNNSAIRMMFEEGNRLRAKYGADKVYDFSLGNPAVPVVMKMKKGAFTSEENPKLYKYLERGKGTVCHQ